MCSVTLGGAGARASFHASRRASPSAASDTGAGAVFWSRLATRTRSRAPSRTNTRKIACVARDQRLVLKPSTTVKKRSDGTEIASVAIPRRSSQPGPNSKNAASVEGPRVSSAFRVPSAGSPSARRTVSRLVPHFRQKRRSDALLKPHFGQYVSVTFAAYCRPGRASTTIEIPKRSRSLLICFHPNLWIAARVKRASQLAAGELVFGGPKSYWVDLQGYDPAEAAKSLDQPLLILQGGREYQVTRKDFDRWKQALGARPGVEFKLYPAANHLFINATGPSEPKEYDTPGFVAEPVVADIVRWIAKVHGAK